MAEPVDVVWNPNAYRIRRDARLLHAVRGLAAGRLRVHETPDVSSLDDVVRRLHGRSAPLVAMCGGDGSYMSLLSALARLWPDPGSWPVVSLLPGGTVSTAARAFGLRGDLLHELGALLARHERGAVRATARPTLRVQDRVASRVGFMFGTALVANFFDAYYGAGGAGYFDAARIVARIFFSSFVAGPYSRRVLDPMPMSIEADGVTLAPGAYSLVLASAIRDVGLHMRVCYRAGEDPERIHLVAAPMPTRELGPQMLRVVRGKRLVGDGHFDELVRTATVRFDVEGTYVLDGDVFRTDGATVRAGPRVRIADYG